MPIGGGDDRGGDDGDRRRWRLIVLCRTVAEGMQTMWNDSGGDVDIGVISEGRQTCEYGY
jgi:hypothetical protein